MDILDLGSEAAPSDASPWAATLEMIFATVQGPVPPAPMQLEVARQARSVVEQIALAPLVEADPNAPWIAIAQPTSVLLMSGERSLVAQLQLGSVVTLDMAVSDQAAWSVVWGSIGANLESMLSGALSGSAAGVSAQPAVRIGVFQGDRRVAETSFNEAGTWQDDLDDQALTDEVNRRLEEAAQGATAPEEGLGPSAGFSGSATNTSAQSPPASPSTAPGMPGISSGVLAGAAAAVVGVAAAAVAREVSRRRAEGESQPPSPTPPSPPPPPVSSLPVRWYYMREARQEGPIEEPAIRQLIVQGIITVDTLVWNESLPDWTTAARAGLVAAPQTVFPKPPPPPPPTAAPPGNPSLATRPCPKCRAQVGARARFCTSCGHPIS